MEASLEISESLLWELHFLMLAVLLGLCMRGGYDLLITFRRLVKHGNVWTNVEDLVYCVCGAFLTFSMFYNENEGAPRGFALAGVAIGLALYHFGPSRLVCWLLEHVLLLVTWPVRKIIKFLKKAARKMLKCP